MTKPTISDGLLTSEQAAQLADMSRQALQGHISAGRIKPCAILGGRNLFARRDIQAWLQRRKKTGAKKRGPKASKNGNKKASK